MDFLIGGVAAMGAVIFSNPFDVVKTRMQLQGELKSRGNYAVFYKNVPHAVITIIKTDGILAIQKGLVAALGFQFVINSTRLGIYQTAESNNLTKNKAGETNTLKRIFYGTVAGVVGAFLGSPFYLVKTQIQSSAHKSIAVGHQYHHTGVWSALKETYIKNSIKGLWRGWESSVARAGFGSPVQLTTFSSSKDILRNNGILLDSPIWAAFVASNISGVALAIYMCPFDVVATRLYNQEINQFGKGILYNGVIDCGIKILRTEGMLGLYKGVVPLYLRVAPHTVLCLIFWDYLKDLFERYKLK